MNRSRCFARTALLAAVVPLAALVGCEREEVKNARAVQASLNQHAGAGTPEAYSALEKAAADAGSATEPAKVDANAALGLATYAKAQAQIPVISSNEAAAHRLIAEMLALGGDVATDNLLIDAYKSGDPSGAAAEGLKTFDTVLADLQGEAKKLDDQIKALNDRKAALEGEIKTMEGQLAGKTKEANDLLVQSEQAKGAPALELYKKSLDARAEAGKIQDQLRIRQADLNRLVTTKNGNEAALGEIEAAQNTRAVVEESIKAAQGQIEEIKKGWAETQAKIEERSKGSRAVLESKSNEIQGLAARAEAFAQATKAAAEARQLCVDKEDGLLSKAIKAYEAAATAGNAYASQKLQSLMSETDSPSYRAFAKLKQTYAPEHFRFAAARVQYARGVLHAQHHDLLQAQLGLVNILTETLRKAGLEVPKELGSTADLTTQIKRVADAARSDLEPLAGEEGPAGDIASRGKANTGSETIETEAKALRAAACYALFHVTGDEKHRAMAENIVQGLDKEALGEASDGRLTPGATYPLLPADIKRALPSSAVSVPAAGVPPRPTAGGTDNVEAGGTPGRNTDTGGGLLRRLGDTFKVDPSKATPPAPQGENPQQPGNQ